MRRSQFDEFVARLDPRVGNAVYDASALKTAQRRTALAEAFSDPDAARSAAERIKSEVLERLPEYVDQLERRCREHGVFVHRCHDAAHARQTILDIVRVSAPQGATVAKAKSMATEEIALNEALSEAGYRPIETDLGEFVAQLDGDGPSHIVTPIIHKTRHDVGRTFASAGLGVPTGDPEELTRRARAHLRRAFREAAVGVSGVNFAVAETGRLVLVENEGNSRLSTTAPGVHIALMGIEKILPREADLPLFLRLLAGSATGQRATVYTHFISGPRRSDEPDGPEEVHLVLLDNGRSRILDGPYRDILRCIRCGACLNACPVYRKGTGHAYGHVYSGPLGAVLAPAMDETRRELARASTLCGACVEACPVKIPIPSLLLKHRAEMGADPAMSALATTAARPALWRASLRLLPLATAANLGPLAQWSLGRTPPRKRGRGFRAWWSRRDGTEPVRRFPASKKPPMEAAPPDIPALDPWDLFGQRLRELGGRIVVLEDIAELQGPVWVDDDAWALLPETVRRGIHRASSPWEAVAGVTVAECAVADLGGLIVSAKPGRRRLASLAPAIHVALVRRQDLAHSLEDAADRWPVRTSVLICGPSRTADIEGVLVRGVHGPAEVWVIVLDD